MPAIAGPHKYAGGRRPALNAGGLRHRMRQRQRAQAGIERQSERMIGVSASMARARSKFAQCVRLTLEIVLETWTWQHHRPRTQR